MSRVILFDGLYSVGLCRQFPNVTFIFGDNTRGFGKGGQAIIRDEPNAFGVPTKRLPSMTRSAFFREGDEDGLEAILAAIGELWAKLKNGETILFPVTPDKEVSLGLGLAKLNETAPSLYGTIALHMKEMADFYGADHASNGLQLAGLLH